MNWLFINNRVSNKNDAKISISDRGLRFGDGVFETIAVYNSVPYQWELHQKRLKNGLKRLKITADIENLLSNSISLIKKNKTKDGILRIMITRGSGGAGYSPKGTKKPTIIIETLPAPKKTAEGVKLWLSSTSKTPAQSIPPECKTMNGLNSILARMEAEENDCFDALMLNTKEQVCETSSGNIFWIKGKKLFTPSLECGILPGTTRAAVIRIANLKLNEGVFRLKDLEKADEVFITNTSLGIMPVSAIHPIKKKWSVFTKTKLLQKLLQKDIDNYVRKKN